MVAPAQPLSRPRWNTNTLQNGSNLGGAKAYEAAFSGLHESANQPVAREVQILDNLAVQLHAALRDHAPSLAGRGQTEEFDQQRGQMEWIAGR